MFLAKLAKSARRITGALVLGLIVMFALSAHAAGEPMTLAELNAWYPEPPAGQNAAPVYAEAFAPLPEKSSDSTPSLAASQKTLALLHRAAQLPECRYPVDLTVGLQTKQPHLAKIRQAAELLKSEAITNASDGRTDLAVKSMQAGLALARSLEKEPVVLSQLVRSRTIDLVTSALEQSLRRKAFSETELATLQIFLKIAETNDTLAYSRAMVGERLWGLTAFKSPADFFKMATDSSASTTNEMDAEFEKLLANYVKGGTNKLDQIYYLKQMDAVILISKLPLPDRLDRTELWRNQAVPPYTNGFIVSACLLPAIAKILEKSAVSVAGLRVAQTVLAIERYRLANANSLPNSLKDLTPQFLDFVPADPFDGQSLRFKIIPKRGYMVYSIGNDRTDDGGIHKPEKPLAGSHYDLAMSVLRK